MPTLTASQVGLETLERGRRLRVTVSGNGAAVVQRSYGGQMIESVALAPSAVREFGEYHVDMAFRLVCQAGTLVYLKAQSVAEVGGGASVNGTEDVPGLDPVLEDLDVRVTGLSAALTGINGGGPSTNFAGILAISGGTP